jgi:paraquat-inducible protein B
VADETPIPDLADLPEAVATPKKRGSLQLVWIVPIVAAVIGAWLAIQAFIERGPTITVKFKTAEGLEAGKTRIKYKEVDIGLVTEVALGEDRKTVVATAEVSKQAESFLVEDTRFWVVRPRVAGGQVSGLGTLLSGSYVGIDPGNAPTSRRNFTGRETAPIVTGDRPGRQFVLRADELGSLEIGSPVYFRRLQVGEVIGFKLAKDGTGVSFRIFVRAPYDRFVTAGSRFWNASGVDVALDAAGFRVQTQSLTSILLGGIAFQTPPDAEPGPPSVPNTEFTLFANQSEAFKHPDTVAETYLLLFDQSVRGLSVGAAVDFRGLVIGEVTAIGLDIDPATMEIRSPVEIRIYPDRLRARLLRPVSRARDSVESVRRYVDRGLRGQLRSGNLLTGQLYVALDFFPNAPKITLDPTRTPLQIPTVPGAFEELQTTLGNIVSQLERVPFEQIGDDVHRALVRLDPLLQAADKLVKDLGTGIAPELHATLGQARQTLATAEHGLLATDAPVQTDLRETLREVRRATEALRNLSDFLERHPESLIRGKQRP